MSRPGSSAAALQVARAEADVKRVKDTVVFANVDVIEQDARRVSESTDSSVADARVRWGSCGRTCKS